MESCMDRPPERHIQGTIPKGCCQAKFFNFNKRPDSPSDPGAGESRFVDKLYHYSEATVTTVLLLRINLILGIKSPPTRTTIQPQAGCSLSRNNITPTRNLNWMVSSNLCITANGDWIIAIAWSYHSALGISSYLISSSENESLSDTSVGDLSAKLSIMNLSLEHTDPRDQNCSNPQSKSILKHGSWIGTIPSKK